MRIPFAHPLTAVILALALALAGCGSSTSTHSSSTTTTSAAAGTTSRTPAPAVAELAQAERPSRGSVPADHGRDPAAACLDGQAGRSARRGHGHVHPGLRRFAFALTDPPAAFVYAPTALYIGRSASGVARGPFLAPADPLAVPPAYRSAQNTGPGGIEAIYAAELPLPAPGTYTVLALTLTPQGLTGSQGEIAVAASSPIPDVGQRPPAITTDTLASVHGDLALLTTRGPPESMHSVSFRDVLGKQPVALLFSTPQLCLSRVCGPVTDIAVWLQQSSASASPSSMRRSTPTTSRPRACGRR